MDRNKRPLIIVLSGTYGVGKTTLAHQISVDLQIMTKMGLSSITNTLKTVIPDNPIVQTWNNYDQTEIEYVKSKLKNEAELIGKVIDTIVCSAERTGENYIVDGAQLLPEFLPMDKILFFRIYLSDEVRHKKQFTEPTITRVRHKNNPSFDLVKIIDKVISDKCHEYPIFNINNIGTPSETSKQIIKIIKDTHPDYINEYLWFEKKTN